LYKTQGINSYATGGIRTRNPSKQAATGRRLIPRGDWDEDTFMFIFSVGRQRNNFSRFTKSKGILYSQTTELLNVFETVNTLKV
jgi:hypothetical protein